MSNPKNDPSTRVRPCQICEKDTPYVAACRSGCAQHRLCPWCISWLNLMLSQYDPGYKGEGVFVLCPKIVPDAERVVHAMGGHSEVSERVIERLASLGWPMDAADAIARASQGTDS